MRVRYSPLAQQFAEIDEVFAEIRALVASGDFTLGKPVGEFEAQFAETLGVRHAIGVGSGTDALKLPLKALGLGHGDEVITCANTFWATAGAIAEVGARPVFVDADDSFCIDPARIEAAIGPRTRAIMPVHLTGDAADMPRILEIAKRHGLPVVEDGCQSLMGELDGKRVGTFGIAAGFSMHPLKIINVWGDAGVVVTDDDDMAAKLRLLRNHGLKNRDEMVLLGYNTRLDSLQAVVGKWILRQIGDIVRKRAENAVYLDTGLHDVSGIRLPPRNRRVKNVYLLYVIFAERRDELLRFCLKRGIEAKIHYPIPLYLQEGLRFLGHKPGDFPVTDRHAREMITFPVDQHLSRAELDSMIAAVQDFYAGKPA
ncbi:MAG: DegT/DnrJ/EryC1/StrS family aminotransferase [Proteobacteria bacterium]|nr:DegT/DnrJ/EryC1/StrS family aminotransferase [Pseudomonadota bacterium]